MNNSKASQKILVRELGEQIGYGNLMHLASECWQESLKAKGLPPGGAFSVGLPYDLLVKNDNEPEILGVIKNVSGTRVSYNFRWLVFNQDICEFQVYERRPYQKKTRLLITTNSETEAVTILIDSEDE